MATSPQGVLTDPQNPSRNAHDTIALWSCCLGVWTACKAALYHTFITKTWQQLFCMPLTWSSMKLSRTLVQHSSLTGARDVRKISTAWDMEELCSPATKAPLPPVKCLYIYIILYNQIVFACWLGGDPDSKNQTSRHRCGIIVEYSPYILCFFPFENTCTWMNLDKLE